VALEPRPADDGPQQPSAEVRDCGCGYAVIAWAIAMPKYAAPNAAMTLMAKLSVADIESMANEDITAICGHFSMTSAYL
jgi:hypothetical protein